MKDCQKKPPKLLIQGAQEFNSGLYYECHETLEELWLQESAAVRELYQGILQIGVALYKQGQANFRGTVNLLRRGLFHLSNVNPICQGIDVQRLITDSDRVLTELLELGPERIAELDPVQFPQVHWALDHSADTVL
jgi:predicted metal-dependent hydrolase